MAEEQKIALVTGANKGIGFEIARQLGAQNITVLLGVRSQERGQAALEKLLAEQIEAVVVPLDVTDPVSIEAAAAFIDQTYGHLDILVNNAAITVDERKSPPSQLAMADLQKVFATNFFGVFAVIGAMLPLLKRSQAGRIVNLSSKAGSLALASTSASGSFFDQIPPALAYTSSKTALNALTVAFARELRGTKIKINAVSPGYVATDLNDHSGLLTPEQGAHEPVAYATLPEDGPHGGFFGSEGAISW